jgi:hypothetical protein
VIKLFTFTINILFIAAYRVVPVHRIHSKANSLNALVMLKRNENSPSECISLSQLRKRHEVLVFDSVFDFLSLFINQHSLILVGSMVRFNLV